MEESAPLVLVVDDDPIIRSTMGQLLKINNYNVIDGKNGIQALELFKLHLPDIVLMDASMPEMNGFDACRHLKEIPEAEFVPVLIITGLDDDKSIDAAFAAGAEDFIQKPVHWPVLKRRLQYLLQAKHSEKNQKEYAINLQNLNANKDKFFSIISHDLRAPFNTLLGVSELLKNQADSLTKEEIKKYSHYIYAAAENFFNLLENLLQWSRAQLGKLEYLPAETELYSLVAKSTEILKDLLTNKNIHIENQIDKNTVVYIDSNMILSVFQNLISNAIKFSNWGGTIEIRSARLGQLIEVSVADNGIGISEKNRELLFRLDKHFTTTGTNDEKGTGLGLILCKELVEKNRGQIRVESNFGEGSTFIVTFPAEGSKEITVP